MPIYEYVCRDCQSEFELLVRNHEQARCPHCQSETLEKQFSVIAAPNTKSNSLPVRGPMPVAGGCGLPQCGQGRCQFD